MNGSHGVRITAVLAYCRLERALPVDLNDACATKDEAISRGLATARKYIDDGWADDLRASRR